MKTAAIIVIGLVIFGTVATYARYESFSPCDWMEQDLVQQSGLPAIMVKGQIHSRFLARGVVDPSPYDCLKMWWRLRAEGTIKPNPDRDE